MSLRLLDQFGFEIPPTAPEKNGEHPRQAVRPIRIQKSRAHYEGGEASNLFADWWTGAYDLPSSNIRIVRNRCRAMERDDGYFRRFLTLLKVMVFGSTGIKLETKIKNHRRTDTLNKPLNMAVLDLWNRWQEAGNCDVTGKLDGLSSDAMTLRRCATDGEMFVRLVRGFDNEFGFALQHFEPEAVDWEHFEKLKNGNEVIAGIELNKWRRPVGYWLRTELDPALQALYPHSGPRERIPARDIIHVAIWSRPVEIRTAPWAAAAVWHLRNLHEYEKAEVIASRVGASKMGFIEQTNESAGYTGSVPANPNDPNSEPVIEMAPGQIELLNPGQAFKAFDPGQPKSTFAEFRKAILRGIAAALDCGYNHLASDLEGVNYSSLKFGDSVDRQVWRFLQSWFIGIDKRRVFEAFLEMVTLKGLIEVGGYDMTQVPVVIAGSKWKPRGFPPIDPLKDRQAQKLAIDNLLDTRTDILYEEAKDIEELIETTEYEQELAEEHNVELSKETKPTGSSAGGSAGSSSDGSGDDEPKPAQEQ